MNKMGRDYAIRFLERLSFGRPYAVLLQGLLVLLPIFLSLLSQESPQFFTGYSIYQLMSLLSVFGSLSIILGFLILSAAGASTYSPSLHSPFYVLQSLSIHLLISGVTVYLGFIVLYYPETARFVPSTAEFLVGGILTALLSVGFVLAVALRSYSRSGKTEKEQLITGFLDECDKLKSSASGVAEADVDKIEGLVLELLEELDAEPMRDSDILKEELDKWYEDFSKYNTGGKRKMVGGIPHPKTELEEPWSTLYDQFQSVEKKLSTMDSTAVQSIKNG